LPENADNLIIKGSENLLYVAIYNIIDNANKFSNYAIINVKLEVMVENIIISIEDFGIGIPENEIEKIYQTFYRANNARGHIGSGVGLSLTEKIIRLHKSTLSISSKIGEGTIVDIVFPKK
jgi:signal transduction histidine kinase